MRILIIEDDKDLCQNILLALEQAGYHTECCHTGSDGLYLAKTNTYDAIILDRMLPEIEMGDLLVIHDTGAHGYSMGYNYNGKLRSAELLLKEDGTVEQIRRAETYQDYFATLKDCKMMKKYL